jgi:hypothetical protein
MERPSAAGAPVSTGKKCGEFGPSLADRRRPGAPLRQERDALRGLTRLVPAPTTSAFSNLTCA